MRKLDAESRRAIRRDQCQTARVTNNHLGAGALTMAVRAYFVANARRRSSNIVLAGKPIEHAYVLKSSNFFPCLTAMFCISRILSPTIAYVDAYPGPFPWCAGNSWW